MKNERWQRRWSVAGTTTLDRECHFIYSKGNNSDKEYNKDFFFIENEYVNRKLLRKGDDNTESRALWLHVEQYINKILRQFFQQWKGADMTFEAAYSSWF